MKQIDIASYFRNGYSRFMKYFNDVFEHPKRGGIEQRLEMIRFFDDYGALASKRAFGKSRSAIYLWKQKLKKAGGKLSSLAPGDKTPLNKRKRLVHPFILDFILKHRTRHPGVDKTTISPALGAAGTAQGIKPVSESTVGRIIHDLKKRGRLPSSNKISINARFDKLVVREPKARQKKMRRKGFLPQLPGDLVQMDTVAIFTAGLKRDIFTAIDVRTRFALPIRLTLLQTVTISWASSLRCFPLPSGGYRRTMAVSSPNTSMITARRTG